MGLHLSYINFINSSNDKVYGLDTKGLKMLELGDQIVKRKSGISERTGKDYFTNLGYDHISVDLNGKRGSLIKDLTKPTDFNEWPEYFDILTNSGTTEHVETFESQYDCFKILHDCVKVGGLMIHLIPDIEALNQGHFVNHCNYYYSEKFFNELALNSNYTILENPHLEAYDCIALSILANKTSESIYIITSDNDYMQLLNESQNIQIWNLAGKQISLDKNGLKELFCKIVMGDVSDNIPAILKKCGPKTALKCFQNPTYFGERLQKENALEKRELNQLLIDFNNIPEYLKEEYLNKFKVL